jgi:hypothetical protein
VTHRPCQQLPIPVENALQASKSILPAKRHSSNWSGGAHSDTRCSVHSRSAGQTAPFSHWLASEPGQPASKATADSAIAANLRMAALCHHCEAGPAGWTDRTQVTLAGASCAVGPVLGRSSNLGTVGPNLGTVGFPFACAVAWRERPQDYSRKDNSSENNVWVASAAACRDAAVHMSASRRSAETRMPSPSEYGHPCASALAAPAGSRAWR